MSRKGGAVPRPAKRTEWQLVFATRDAEKGWTDLLATARNATVDAWDTLTREPTVQRPRLYQLKGDYAYGRYSGRNFARYQLRRCRWGRRCVSGGLWRRVCRGRVRSCRRASGFR